MNKIILFELNEVPLRVFDYYRTVRPDSWIARNFNKFKKCETFSENQGHLSPWNTWPTLHRGVANDKHFISDFNQDLSGVDAEFPPIWDLLSKSGVKVGVFGSLHSYPLPQNVTTYDFYVPDVFAAGSECFPESVELFQDINLRLSRESARNIDRSIPYNQVGKLLLNFGELGFKASTVLDVGGQLIQEKIAPWKVTRRRTYQSVIAFDVFYKLLRKNRPDFVTFFTNHVASSMHRYWAALFPDDYEDQKYERDWIETYNGEILFAMDKTDKMLSRLGSFIEKDPDYRLLITSSMGQHAIECEPLETQLYIVDKRKFMAMLGAAENDFKSLPSMLPQFNFALAEDKAAAFEDSLRKLKVNGVPVIYRPLEGRGFSIDFGHANLKATNLTIGTRSIDLSDSGLENVVIEDKSSSTAYHIPEGHLFSYHPSFPDSEAPKDQLPTAEIAAMILRNFDIAQPGYMPRAIPNAI
jgi:hypothetical protein